MLSNLATRDNTFSQIVYQTQSDFSTIVEYRKVMKEGAAKYTEL